MALPRRSPGIVELSVFLRPFLSSVKGQVVGALLLGGAAVVAGAMVPLLVESTLQHADMARYLGLLVAAMVAEVCFRWAAQRLSYRSAARAASDLALDVYAHTVERPAIRQVGLRRPSVISRHTSDVDRIEEALDASLADGFPGIARIGLSLTLLVYVEPRAGVIMALGTVVFFVVYAAIGRGLLSVDRERLDASSDVGGLVDESITAERSIRGMNLVPWMRARLAQRVDRLQLATIVQKRQATRLVVAARSVGYIALLGVVVEGLVGGAAEAGAIAAALLYIDAIVRGLEALPPWLREVRLAVTSKRRIEQITLSSPSVHRDEVSATSTLHDRGLALHDLAVEPGNPLTVGTVTVPAATHVAVVADAGQSSSRLLELLAGESDPDGGRVTLDGVDVRHPHARRRIVLVAQASHLMDATTMEHLRACDPFLTADQAQRVLAEVSLEYLNDLPDGGLDRRLGTHGSLLSVHERQRLLLAMGICASAEILLVEGMPLLADIDTAGPLLAALSHRGKRPVIVAARNEELAAHCEHVLVLGPEGVRSGEHSALMTDPSYRAIWDRQASIDQRMLDAVPAAARAALRSRITTEQFPAGETLFRAGAPADQLMYIMSGRVAVLASGDGGSEVRIGEIGPGDFCGDLENAGGRHGTTARAERDTTVRTLSVESWSAGILGLLDGTAIERRIMRMVLRAEAPTAEAIKAAIPEEAEGVVLASIEALVADQRLHRAPDGALSLTARRRTVSGAASVLDSMSQG